MISERALIDSNVLVYIIDSSEERKTRTALKLLDTVAQKPSEYVVAEQNLREFSAVISRNKQFPEEKFYESLNAFLSAFGEIIRDEIHDWLEAFTISRSHATSYWDALLAATMKRHGITKIITENVKDFRKVPGLTVENPFKG